jgi:hypothetical protein
VSFSKRTVAAAIDLMIDDAIAGQYVRSETGLGDATPGQLESLRRNLKNRLGVKPGERPITPETRANPDAGTDFGSLRPW